MATFPLKKGDSGPEVKKVQQFLNGVSELQGRPVKLKDDGDFGGKTEDALKLILLRKQVTEGDYRLGLRVLPTLTARLAAARRSGESIDAKLRKMMKDNEETFYNLLDIYKKYKSGTAAYRERYKKEFAQAFDIGMRFNRRLELFLKKEESGEFFTRRGLRAGYEEAAKELATFKATAGIGALPLLLVPIICAIVGGVGTAAVIYITTNHAGDSVTDWKQSEEINRILSQLKPEERKAVETEVEQQLQTSYEAGYDKGKPGFFDNLGGNAKTAALAVAALLLFQASKGRKNG